MYNRNTDPVKREAFIDGIIAKMSLEQKVGQCFTIHWGGSIVTPYVLEAIEKAAYWWSCVSRRSVRILVVVSTITRA